MAIPIKDIDGVIREVLQAHVNEIKEYSSLGLSLGKVIIPTLPLVSGYGNMQISTGVTLSSKTGIIPANGVVLYGMSGNGAGCTAVDLQGLTDIGWESLKNCEDDLDIPGTTHALMFPYPIPCNGVNIRMYNTHPVEDCTNFQYFYAVK